MTTTAHEDQFTVGTQTIETVRQPYSTVAILRRNVADLELALRTQTERAEAAEAELLAVREDMQSWIDSRNGWMERAGAAEAELARLREQKQKPMGWIDADGDFYHGRHYPNVWPTAIPVYVEPTPAPAVPYGVDEEAANRIALAVYDCKNDICPEPLLYAINRILATEAHPLSVEGRDALLPSAPQAPAVPELDPMTRLIVSDPKQIKPKKQEPAVPEFCAVEAQLTLAEIIRDARRYLVLRNAGALIVGCPQMSEYAHGSALDAAADRLLEGGG